MRRLFIVVDERDERYLRKTGHLAQNEVRSNAVAAIWGIGEAMREK